MKLRKEWVDEKSELERRLQAWAKNLNLAFFSLTPVFRAKAKESEDLYFPIDGHWTPEGHRVAAAAIETWLKTDHLAEGSVLILRTSETGNEEGVGR
jgi:hypothetical protein